MNTQHILLATDFSEGATIAAAQTIALAARTGARVTVLHVGGATGGAEPPADGLDALAVGVASIESDKSHEVLDELVARCEAAGVEATALEPSGDPAKTISKTAVDRDADLVIVGSHGRTGFRRLVLGSVAERTVRICKRPVLVARPDPAWAGHFRRVLVPTDFSPLSALALHFAEEFCEESATIELFHCCHMPPGAITYAGAPSTTQADIADLREQMAEQAERAAKKLKETWHGRLDVTFTQEEVDPVHGILDRLGSGDYDLVVMGTRGRHGLSRLALGSVAEAVVRKAHCSVLTLHQRSVARVTKKSTEQAAERTGT